MYKQTTIKKLKYKGILNYKKKFLYIKIAKKFNLNNI